MSPEPGTGMVSPEPGTPVKFDRTADQPKVVG
jgi:hypothetical protein